MYHPNSWPDTGLRSPGESASHDASDLVAALRRGWRVMLVCLLTGLVIALAYVATTPSIYAANTQILFEPKRIEIAGSAEREATQFAIESAQIESQIQILKSERLSDVVIRAHQLEGDPEFTESRPSLFSRALELVLGSSAANRRNIAVVADEFEKKLDVRRIGQSYALDLWFRSADPAKAARLANAVTAAYVAQQLVEVGRTGRGSQFQKTVAGLDAERRAAADAVQTGTIDFASFPVADARVLKAAQVPLGRAAPRTNVILALAGVLALLFGASFIIIRQRLSPTILTRRQVEDDLGVPCLAVLPNIKSGAHIGREQLANMSINAPASPFGRGLNAVRAALDAQFDGPDAQCVGIAAATPGQGQSLIAANLAHAFAACGWKTLLIDCEQRSVLLRRSGITEAPAGPTDILRGIEFESLKRYDGALTVVPVGQSIEGDARGIGSPKFRAFLHAAKNHYERIVVDLPSIEAAPDVAITCSWLSATLIVFAAGQTTESVARQALTALRRARASLAGAILNRGRL